MGNCQAIDNATLAVQHPSGRVEKLYWPATAADIMKMNPGHHVALLLTTTLCPSTIVPAAAAAAAADATKNGSPGNATSVRITRIKLLRPTDTLLFGHSYRLITTQEVMKGLRAKKYAKVKKKHPESAEKQEGLRDRAAGYFDTAPAATNSGIEKTKHVSKRERHRPRRTSSANCPSGAAVAAATAKGRAWHPSLNSISEAGS